MIKKLLIANRGEIVRRVIRSARDLGIETVSVYSDADKDSPHVKAADEAVHIGASPPPKSYLNINNIIEAALQSGADAVHPGYGFLSENAQFVKAVQENGMIFVGPSSQVLSTIESKCRCREIAHKAGVPVTPGTLKIIQHSEEIHQVFEKYGGPLLLKLDKGGGGKGIQTINHSHQIENVWEACKSIGTAAFGSSDCYAEKGVQKARHIEVQLLGDFDGNFITLGERECSIQRRYQKVIEESPSPVVSEGERKELHKWTVRIAREIGYQGAGTIEYLRSDDGQYYFMEINARIQVEHPVTELITGIDIVRAQLEIASGKKLAIDQSHVRMDGHSIQARIYAEDPVTFQPSPGIIGKLRFPEIKKVNTRFDHALEEGQVVSPFYDPLLAKVIVWGSTRQAAIDRLFKRLSYFQIDGTNTSIPLVQMILKSDEFFKGDFHTDSLESIMAQYEYDTKNSQYRRK